MKLNNYYSYNASYTMLASSAAISNKEAVGRQTINIQGFTNPFISPSIQSELTAKPLAGVVADMNSFKDLEKRGQTGMYELILSTKGQLLSRNTILQRIQKSFQKASCNFFLFTGHGYENDGAMCIETQEKPDGEKLFLKEVIDIFINVKQKNGQLRIFLDSCFSGAQVEAIYKTYSPPLDATISINSSSDKDNPSKDIAKIGGTLIFQFWLICTQAPISKFQKQNILKIKEFLKEQHPQQVQVQNKYWEDIQQSVWMLSMTNIEKNPLPY